MTSFVYTYSKDKYISVFCKYVCFLLLFIPAAIRYGIGTDYDNYKSLFINIQSDYSITQEPGWYLLNSLIIKMGLEFQWVIAVSSFFIIYFVFKTPKKEFFVIIVLFYCLYYLDSYNAIRQALAMSICWYSYLCYQKAEKFKSYTVIGFATLFHYSSLVYLLVAILFNFFQIKKKINYVTVILILIVLSSSSLLMQLLFAILSFTRYSVYIEHLVYYNQRAGGFGNIWSIIIRFAVLLWMSLSIHGKQCTKNEYSSIQLLTITLLFFDILGISIFMFQRMRLFFFITYMAIMKHYIYKKSDLSIMKNCLFVAFIFVYYLILKLLTGANNIIPYTHIELF